MDKKESLKCILSTILASIAKIDSEDGFSLDNHPQGLGLSWVKEPELKPLVVDFCAGAVAYRRQYGGGRKELIARAVGIKGDYLPDIIDATAGLGGDSLVLAALGCKVIMLERSPWVAALLADALIRGEGDEEVGQWMRDRLSLVHSDSLSWLKDQGDVVADVIYLDPMYPSGGGQARVKKGIYLLQQLHGPAEPSQERELLKAALSSARKRVVVKRPNRAEPLAGIKPTHSYQGKRHRFDVFIKV